VHTDAPLSAHAILEMAPPSKVAIATGSVLRLVKEEASYHKEIIQQEERIKKLESSTGDENKEYTLKQEVR
jgi:tubulin-specific chaperone A